MGLVLLLELLHDFLKELSFEVGFPLFLEDFLFLQLILQGDLLLDLVLELLSELVDLEFLKVFLVRVLDLDLSLFLLFLLVKSAEGLYADSLDGVLPDGLAAQRRGQLSVE